MRENTEYIYHSFSNEQSGRRQAFHLSFEDKEPVLSLERYRTWFGSYGEGFVPTFPPSFTNEKFPFPIAAELQLAFIPADADDQDLAFRFLEGLCNDEGEAYLKNMELFAATNPFFRIHISKEP